VTFVLAGSEVGLLYGFLGIDGPFSPLHRRYCFRLTLEKLGKDLSTEFLRQGLKEVDPFPASYSKTPSNPPPASNYLEKVLASILPRSKPRTWP